MKQYLFQFIDKFNEVKEATRTAINKSTNGGAVVTPVTSANASPISARAATAAPDASDNNLLEPPGKSHYFQGVLTNFVILNNLRH